VSTSGEDGNKNLKLYKRWIISRLAEQLWTLELCLV
jgi:hypothetical protein